MSQSDSNPVQAVADKDLRHQRLPFMLLAAAVLPQVPYNSDLFLFFITTRGRRVPNGALSLSLSWPSMIEEKDHM